MSILLVQNEFYRTHAELQREIATLRTRMGEAEGQRDELVRALEAAKPYVRAERLKLMNAAAGLSDKAFRVYEESPEWKKIFGDYDAIEEALKKVKQ